MHETIQSQRVVATLKAVHEALHEAAEMGALTFTMTAPRAGRGASRVRIVIELSEECVDPLNFERSALGPVSSREYVR